jgi:DNA primase
LIAQNVISNANVVYIAVAPDGKEVEELEGKEILMALRKRMPVKEFLYKLKRGGDEVETHKEVMPSADEVKQAIKKVYSEIKDTKKAAVLNTRLEVVKTVLQSSVMNAIARDAGPLV